MSDLSDLEELDLNPDRGSRSYGQLRRQSKNPTPIGANKIKLAAWRRELRGASGGKARAKNLRKAAK